MALDADSGAPGDQASLQDAPLGHQRRQGAEQDAAHAREGEAHAVPEGRHPEAQPRRPDCRPERDHELRHLRRRPQQA